MGDRRLHLARARARVPAQPVADDDAVRAGDGRPVQRASGCSSTASAGSRSPPRRSAGTSCTGATAARRSYGLPAALLEPGQVQALVPLVDPERILGGLHTPTDGIAKALRAAEAMATAAGVDAYGGCEVTGFEIERGAVRAVHTALGTIRTSAVVLAAGIWGPKVAAAGRRPAPARPRPAPVRGDRAAARAGRRDARGRPPDPAPPGRRPVLPPGRRRVRDRQLRPRAAAGRAVGDRRARRARAAVDAAVHAGGLRPRRGGDRRGCCPPSAARRWHAASTG